MQQVHLTANDIVNTAIGALDAGQLGIARA
jgi:hypothetical protein